MELNSKSKLRWENLSADQKLRFKKYCDNKFNETILFSETGEPLYLDENMNMIDTSIVIELFFSSSIN